MAEGPDPDLRRQRSPRRSGRKQVEDLRIQHTITFIDSATQPLTPALALTHQPVSKTSLKYLELISFRELSFVATTKGRYMILRTLEAAFCDSCIKSVVEDHEGAAVKFWWHNVTIDTKKDVNDVLPKGTVFALKEPYATLESDRSRILCCESPSNVVFLYEGDQLEEFTEEVTWNNKIIQDFMPINPETSTASDLMKHGDELFKAGKLHLSIRCYLMTLQKLEELGDNERMAPVVHLKLSKTHYRRGYFESALDFAEKVLKVDNLNDKALIAAGRSSYKLRKFKDAFGYFLEYCKLNEEVSPEIKQEYLRSKTRVVEEERGQFNICHLFEFRLKCPKRPIDCADFVGPIEIIQIEGKGRGVVAKSNIVPGTLLVVSKALSYVWKSNKKGIHEDQAWKYLAVDLGEKMAKNPNTFGSIIYDLYAGDEFPVEQPPTVFCDSSAKEEPIVDLKKLVAIITFNSFGRGPEEGIFKLSLNRSNIKKHGCGLFKWPSYFNHSCVPNTSIVECNDLVIIRAIQHIRAGMEIYIPYLSWEIPLQLRNQFFKSRGFRCQCSQCMVDSNVGEKMAVSQVALQYDYEIIYRELINSGIVSNRSVLIEKTRELINTFASTCPDGIPDYHKSALSPLYDMLSKIYQLPGRPHLEEEIDSNNKILRYLGFNPPDMLRAITKDEDLIPPTAIFDISVLNTVYRQVLLTLRVGELENARKWKLILFNLHGIYYGGGSALVKLLYPEIDQLIKKNIL